MAAVIRGKTFNRYIVPKKRIEAGTKAATGLSVKNGMLFHQGKPVQTVPLNVAVEDFTSFLGKLNYPVIIGHNIANFDVPVLYNTLHKLNKIEAFCNVTCGFVDTHKVAKSKINKNDLPLASYKQENLVNTFVKERYEVHNALADVTSLEKLCNIKLKLSPVELSSVLFTIDIYSHSQSLRILVDKKVVSTGIKTKLAWSNLGLNELKLAHKRDPENGICAIFCEPIGAKMTPRITKSKKKIITIQFSCLPLQQLHMRVI